MAALTGVRVFLEGFRILPYGEPRNDWLGLDDDYARRSRTLKSLSQPEVDLGDEVLDRDAALAHLPNRSYFGGVFLTESGAPELRLVVNREGFIASASYETLVENVRTGIDLCTRVRAAASTARRRSRKQGRNAATSSPARTLRDSAIAAADAVNQINASVVAKNLATISSHIASAKRHLDVVRRSTDDIIAELSLSRILASVGMQMASFVHEMRRLINVAATLDDLLTGVSQRKDLTPATRKRMEDCAGLAKDLTRALETQAAYLADVVGVNARRRRARHRLRDAFDGAAAMFRLRALDEQIEIKNQIPPDLKSPPMFAAELTAIFTNAMSNAIRAAGHSGRVHARGAHHPEGVRIAVENTGRRVALRSAERWFQPFESTSEDLDPTLGQGMGLGLPITRTMVEEYGGQVRFIKPSAGYATALEITLPA